MAKPTIIGYDAKRIVRNGTGLGSYGRTLVNDLSALSEFDLRLYAPDKGMPQLRSQIVGRDNVSFCYPANAHTSAGKALWRTKGIVKQLVRDEVDIYHGLSGELPKGISESGIRSIVTIHDLIFMRHPEYYNKMDVKIYTRKFQQTLREADRIVAISECTRRDISELGEIDASRIDVIYQSCAPRFNEEPQARKMWQVRDKYELPDRYVLNVGSIEERKNVMLAVKALHHLPDDVSLVIVGRQTPYSDECTNMCWNTACTDACRCSTTCPTTTCPRSIAWLTASSTPHATRDSAYPSSRPSVRDCPWWPAQARA